MRKTSPSQPGLFDSTSLGWGFDLGQGGTTGSRRLRETTLEEDRAVSVPALVPLVIDNDGFL